MKINLSSSDKKKQEDLEDLFEVRDLIREWHKIYAWLPIRISDDEVIWLDYVEICYPDATVLEILSSLDPWGEDEVKELERNETPAETFFPADYPMAFCDYELDWGEPVYREFINKTDTIRE